MRHLFICLGGINDNVVRYIFVYWILKSLRKISTSTVVSGLLAGGGLMADDNDVDVMPTGSQQVADSELVFVCLYFIV